jgi:hypothetical protein
MINLDTTQWAHYRSLRECIRLEVRNYWNKQGKYCTEKWDNFYPADRALAFARNLYALAWKQNRAFDRAIKNKARECREMMYKIYDDATARAPVPLDPALVGRRAKPYICSRFMEEGRRERNYTAFWEKCSFTISNITDQFYLRVESNQSFTMADTHYKENELAGAVYLFNNVLLVDDKGKVIYMEETKKAA